MARPSFLHPTAPSKCGLSGRGVRAAVACALCARCEPDPSHVHYFNVRVVSASNPCSMISIDAAQLRAVLGGEYMPLLQASMRGKVSQSVVARGDPLSRSLDKDS